MELAGSLMQPYAHEGGKPLPEPPAMNRAQRRQHWGRGGHPNSLSARRALRNYTRLQQQQKEAAA